ncbi:hypothetical protein RJ55_00296 [Drechmeria coniospora]|nr:hypothetical protein RJ55_00296 [Drechmeria coniospora]
MAKVFDAAEVAAHNTRSSCWVILYGDVYDVTDILASHPGGSNVILKLAGQDATRDYDPVHPAGTLEENLKPGAKLGRVKADSVPRTGASAVEDDAGNLGRGPSLASLLNLDEIEREASRRISKRAYAYYYSASDDLCSKSLNKAVYRDILLRPRVFVDSTACDMSTSVLGSKVDVPFFIAPAAMARLAHPDGEHGLARAAARFGAMQIISNNASMRPERIVEGAPRHQVFGWQMYVQTDRQKSIDMLQRINAMRDRFKFICLTLDAPVPGKREHDEKSSFADGAGTRATDGGAVGRQLFLGTARDLTWATTLPWLARHTDLPVVLKGLQTHEDAYLAAMHAPQVKAIILSNHGGRAMDTAPPPLHTLLEIRKYCPEVFDKVEVWLDGGIRRGTDVVKALCLGATAVGLGRAPLFGLGAGGQAGAERVLEILEAEVATCMRLLGAKSISELGPRFVRRRASQRGQPLTPNPQLST